MKTDLLGDESIMGGTHCSVSSTGTHAGHSLALHVPGACLLSPCLYDIINIHVTYS